MPTSRDRWLPLIYSAAIFVSAFLLFQIQPLISKRILPWFGGTPAVWTTCLVFFQTILFAGYAYAHWTSGWLKPRQQAILHTALIVAALIMMRAFPSDHWEPSGTEQPIPQILLILTACIGVPYFVLSATGPLLQAWFAQSFPGRVPYRLYALSNIGSLLALASYPFFFEPKFALERQARLWTCGFFVYAGLCAYIAWRIGWPKPADAKRSVVANPLPAVPRPHPARYGLWFILAAFGSLVLMATTSHISADIAVIPLLWVVPLAIYLLTFIIAFDRPAWYRRTPVAVLAIVFIYAAAATHHLGVGQSRYFDFGTIGLVSSWFADPLSPSPLLHITTKQFLFANFGALFAVCLLCHGELVRTRPAPQYLTSFFLMIAAGGATGGIFATMVAPHIFTSFFEWDASLFIACLCSIGVVLVASMAKVIRDRSRNAPRWRYAISGVATLVLLLISLDVLVDLSEFLGSDNTNVRWRARNFFGALTVHEFDPNDEQMQRFVLYNGTTTHGSQFTLESRRREPTTYYSLQSGVGHAIDFFHKKLPPGKLRMAVVGLGAGTLAAYPEAGESITYYEINPTVVDLAEHGAWFTYLRDCRSRGAHYDIRLGDARLTLQHELAAKSSSDSDGRAGEGHSRYHLIVLDAFSGDSVPVHLLTAEAFEIYLAKLVQSTANTSDANENGAIAVHVSSLYLDLERVVRALGLRFNLLSTRFFNDALRENDAFEADWVILTHNPEMAAALRGSGDAVKEGTGSPVLWTDDRSSIFEILR